MVKDTQHRAPRHSNHDYTLAGHYFVTVRTQHGLHLFGTVANGTMQRSPAGEMVAVWWNELSRKYPTLRTGEFIVMPNHIHGIVTLGQSGTVALPDVMRWYKAMTTNAYIRGVKTAGWMRFPGKLWQRSYHDHIIRDEANLARIQHYIQQNPATWEQDTFNSP